MPGRIRLVAVIALTNLAAVPALAQDRTNAYQITAPLDAPYTATADQITASGGDPLRIAGPPEGAVDACEPYLAGRAPAPAGINCDGQPTSRARPLNAGPLTPTTIAESGLTAAAPRRDAYVLPDAQDVARRLATGDLGASAVAQAVGSGFGAPPVVADPKDAEAAGAARVLAPPPTRSSP